MGPKSSDKCPYKETEKEKTDQKEKAVEDGGRGGSDGATAQEGLEPPEAGRGKEGFFLEH